MDDINHVDIAAPVSSSLIETFDRMLSMKLEASSGGSSSDLATGRIVSSISLAGNVAGTLNIVVSQAFSRIMAAAMMGVEPDEIESEQDVRGVINKVCHMVAGNLKTKFLDLELNCEFSPPIFTTGTDFTIESLNTDRHERLLFSFEKHSIAVEIGARIDVASANVDAEAPRPGGQYKAVDGGMLQRFDVNTSVTASINDVFKTMLSMDLEPSEEETKPDQEGSQIVGAMSFIGLLMGGFRIIVSDHLSRLMTAEMLGTDIDSIESDEGIKDVIGEVCNIIGGNLKSTFCDSGLTCELSTPTLTKGMDFKSEFQKMPKQKILAFRHKQENVIIEIGFGLSQDAQSSQAENDPRKSAGDDIPKSIDSQDTIDGLITPGTPRQEETQTSISKAPEHQKGESDGKGEMGEAYRNLEFVLDIPVEITVRLGQTTIKISELLEFGQGSVVELSSLDGQPVDVLVNKILIAKGEVVVDRGKYGVRITEIATNMERIWSLR